MKKRNTLNKLWNFPKHTFKVFLFIMVLMFVQLSYLTLFSNVYGINMDLLAENRNVYSKELVANRGTIYDSNGDVLAQNVSSYTVIAYLSNTRKDDYVKDKEKTADLLAKPLNMKKEYILKLLNYDAYQVELGPGGRGITEIKKDEIEELNLPGIDFVEGSKRNYPNGDFASYIIGYAKENEKGNINGELGIESKYNKLLQGKNGSIKYQQDRYGYKIPDTPETKKEPVNGSNVYLTIDSSIQRFIETAVKDVRDEYNPEWLMLTVMDAKNGDILGSGSIPSFDPNIRNIKNYENPLVSYLYEPGSTMKTFSYMCAMEKGTYNGTQKFQSGNIKVGDYTISDWNRTGWGKISYDKGFEYSSNVGVTNMMKKFIDKNELRNCLKKYGFGEKTGIELSRELSGDIRFNYDIEVATASFGQGITTTAIQLLQAATIISNNGKMLKPHIVDKIIKDNEITYESVKEESEQLVSLDTVNNIKKLMNNVISGDDLGTTGYMYEIDGFDIIGKTGTSQIYNNQIGDYEVGENAYIFSFLGMYPKDDPEIIIYTAMKKPKWGKATGMVNATKTVFESIAKYKNMFGDSIYNSDVKRYKLPSYVSKDIKNSTKDLKKNGINYIVLGNGKKVIEQYPKQNTTVLSNENVILKTNDSNILMPNFKGLSKNDVITICKLLNIDYEITGYGYVKTQSIEKDMIIKNGSKLKLKLEDKVITEVKKNAKKNN